MTRLSPGCKLNLTLRVRGRRPDGYHELESVFLPLPYPRDTMEVGICPGSALELRCQMPLAGKNILQTVWEEFAGATGRKTGLRILLHKRIPAGSGLGGASSDAACLLLWLNRQAPRPLPGQELLQLAAHIGADVPFFLIRRPCRAEGIGERLSPLAPFARAFWLVVVWPGFAVATPWAFQAYDRAQNALTKPGNGANGIGALPEPGTCQNDLEEAVFQQFPALADLKRELLELGADQAAMSGSGASLYGLFYHEDAAKRAAGRLRGGFSHVYFLSGPRASDFLWPESIV